jgi:hypothetical protein
VPPATATPETSAAVAAVHNGAQVFGMPEQFVVPGASNAYNFSAPT